MFIFICHEIKIHFSLNLLLLQRLFQLVCFWSRTMADIPGHLSVLLEGYFSPISLLLWLSYFLVALREYLRQQVSWLGDLLHVWLTFDSLFIFRNYLLLSVSAYLTSLSNLSFSNLPSLCPLDFVLIRIRSRTRWEWLHIIRLSLRFAGPGLRLSSFYWHLFKHLLIRLILPALIDFGQVFKSFNIGQILYFIRTVYKAFFLCPFHQLLELVPILLYFIGV